MDLTVLKAALSQWRLICGAVILLAMALVCQVWIRSYTVAQGHFFQNLSQSFHSTIHVVSVVGTVQISAVDDLPDGSHVTCFGGHEVHPGEQWDEVFRSSNMPSTRHTWLGFSWVKGIATSFRPTAYRVLVMPFWSVLLVLTIPLLLLCARPYARYRQARRRKQGGLCLNCGYDIRASLGRCPECGRAGAVGSMR